MRDENRADELQNRLIDFAVRVINVADALPKTAAGRHVAGQVLRCGTSPAPNYAESRGAESRSDFVHKLKIALKELNETSVWLRMICRAHMLKESLLQPLIEENQQLSRILNASISTAKRASGCDSKDLQPESPPVSEEQSFPNDQ